MEGHAPIVTIGVAPPITEQRKYQRMWERAEYRVVAPGEECAMHFLQIAQPAPGSTLIDFGAGTGRGALLLATLGNLNVTMLDFAPNCLDEHVVGAIQHQVGDVFRFKQHDLMQPVAERAQYGYCTDVMEHIPTADVDRVLFHVMGAAEHVYFQISCTEDACGKLIGHVLHHTVQPMEWWLAKITQLGAIVHFSQDFGTHCIVYATAWQTAKDFVDTGTLNTTEQTLLDNMTANLAADWKEIKPHEQNEFEVILLAGGPSLNDHVDTIRQLRAEGAKLICVNGTYRWAIDHGLTPSAMVMVDAREFNKRFLDPLVDTCVYLMSSQCHPKSLEGLPRERTFLWHTAMPSAIPVIQAARPVWYAIPGGSSVTLRAFQLLLTLGYHRFHVFGLDSCLKEVKVGDTAPTEQFGAGTLTALVHHAYVQPENDSAVVVPVTCGTRIFQCHPWMVSQAQEFQDLMRVIGNDVDVEMYGDGLIAHMVRHGASLADAAAFQME